MAYIVSDQWRNTKETRHVFDELEDALAMFETAKSPTYRGLIISCQVIDVDGGGEVIAEFNHAA